MIQELKRSEYFRPFKIILTFETTEDVEKLLQLLRLDIDLGRSHNLFYGDLIETLLSMKS